MMVGFVQGLKLKKDFYNVQKDKFNISKVPDIYDSIKYDLLHNKNILQFPHAEDLYIWSKALADIVVPQVIPSSADENLQSEKTLSLLPLRNTE